MGLLQNLCVFAGVLTPPPAPPVPAQAGFCIGKWYAVCGGGVTHVVRICTRCRLLWRQAEFASHHDCHSGEEYPRTPRGGVQRSPQFFRWTAIFRDICHCSNRSFEQRDFLRVFENFKNCLFTLKKKKWAITKLSSFATALLHFYR